jgi:hypothetical protein
MDTTKPARKHRREVWLHIVAPVALPLAGIVVLCIGLALAVATDALVGKQVTTVMGVVVTLFVLFPLTLLCLIPYFLLVVTAYGAGWMHSGAMMPLQFVRRMTGQLAEQTARHVPKLGRPLIGLNARMTRWEHTLRSLASGKEAVDEGD